MPIGGVKDNILAARRTGNFTCIISSENEKVLKEIPPKVLRSMTAILDEYMAEVLRNAQALTAHATFLSEPSKAVVWHTTQPFEGVEQAQDRILSWYLCPISTGPLEGVHNKINVLSG